MKIDKALYILATLSFIAALAGYLHQELILHQPFMFSQIHHHETYILFATLSGIALFLHAKLLKRWKMKLSKAVEILILILSDEADVWDPDPRDSIHLGIEALQELECLRDDCAFIRDKKLPGEDPE